MMGFVSGKKLVIFIGFSLILIGCATNLRVQSGSSDEGELISVAKEAAGMFYYFPEINPHLNNLIVGPSEVGGQCGDYAAAFVNIWNEKYPGQALLVIQQQGLVYEGIELFPNGVYRIIGKDTRDLPIDWTVSGLYYFLDKTQGIYHPELDNYLLELVEELIVTKHFGIPFENNGPHVWVMVGNISIDPTYADIFGEDFIVGRDEW
jgi:hypothetical protein